MRGRAVFVALLATALLAAIAPAARAAHTVTGFSPSSGPVGTTVTITGTDFTGIQRVEFTGANQSNFTVNAAGTEITTTVPSGAQDGPIGVRDHGSTEFSTASFDVTPPAAPTITSFTPASGAVGTPVQITGTNFTGATAVRFNGVTASFTVANATTINTTVPSGATDGPISVTTAGGTATSTANFDVTPAAPPTITSFNPASGPVGTSVTITGTNLTGATAVRFGGVAATTFSVVNATTVTATVPSGAATGAISVTTPGGTAVSSSSFTVTTGGPTITSFSPTSGPTGTTVQINGTNFTGTTSVRFNGTTAAFTVDSNTRITATVPSGATTGKITVTNPNGTATSASDFTVTGQGPVITSFNPTSGPVGTQVVITGTGFKDTITVKFGNANAAFSVNQAGTQITATVPNNAATAKITITTLVGSTTSSAEFVVTAPPTISSFTPDQGPPGTSVTINGTNFSATSAVRFNGVNATFTVNSNTRITATVPATATTGKITVVNSAGTATSSTDFTVLPPAPTVTSFSPAGGAPGTVVTISGTNFTGATAVTFNGTGASFVVDSATQIRATVPAGASTGPIAVTTPSGTGTSATTFVVPITHPRSVTLGLRRHIVAVGQVSVPDGASLCLANVAVRIQKRRANGTWGTVETTTTTATGSFRARIPDRTGVYRARAPRIVTTTDICARATSDRDRHRH